jgi:DNA-binding IclR family transcriptional regulator
LTDGKAVLNTLADAGQSLSPAEAATDQALSSTLLKGLEILALFSDTQDRFSNSEIARQLGLNKATVSRLCKTLVHIGYLRKDAKGGFMLAPRILSLSYPVLASTRWRHQLAGPMREIAEMSGGNCSLCVISGDVFVQLQDVGNPSSFPHAPAPGITGPLHRSSTGRALLSMLDSPALSDKLAEIRYCYPQDFDEQAQQTLDGIERCRTEGFCVAYGDWRPDIVALSSPLGETEDGLLVTLSCGLPRYRARAEQIESDLGPRLAEATRSMRLTGLFKPPFFLQTS